MDRNTTAAGGWKPSRSKRWTSTDGARMLTALASSGLSKHEFARQHGLNVHKIDYWAERLHDQPPIPGEPPRQDINFVPLQFDEPALAQPAAPLVVVTPDGWRIEVSPRFDTSRLSALVHAFRSELS